MQDNDRILLSKLDELFTSGDQGTPEELRAGIDYASAQGWLELDETGKFARLATVSSADLSRIRSLVLKLEATVSATAKSVSSFSGAFGGTAGSSYKTNLEPGGAYKLDADTLKDLAQAATSFLGSEITIAFDFSGVHRLETTSIDAALNDQLLRTHTISEL